MPDNKRQHYVPTSTLRRFASDISRLDKGKPRQINLLNLRSGKIIRGASLKRQCYRDYFYSADLTYEHAIGSLEGIFSKIAQGIIERKTLSPLDGQHIVEMITLQRARTQHAEHTAEAMNAKMFRLLTYGRVSDDVRGSLGIKSNNLSLHLTGQAMTLSPMMLDLKQFVVINDTDTPFVISDNPVVMTNWFCRQRYPATAPIGFAKSGLQIVMPLSPKIALYLHDSGVYSSVSEETRIHVRLADVLQLNELQCHSAFENIYFSPRTRENELNKLLSIFRPSQSLATLTRFEMRNEPGKYVQSSKDELDGPSEGVQEEIVQIRSPPLPVDIRLEFVRMRRKPKYIDEGTATSPRRDPIWCKIVNDFVSAVEEKRCSYNDLWDFVADHPLEKRIGLWIGKAIRRSAKARTGSS